MCLIVKGKGKNKNDDIWKKKNDEWQGIVEKVGLW
jgi:hypothetical protein